jgi:hypothetical protein
MSMAAAAADAVGGASHHPTAPPEQQPHLLDRHDHDQPQQPMTPQQRQAVLEAAAGLTDPQRMLPERAPHLAALNTLLSGAAGAAAGEALLQAGPRGVVDACLAILASGETAAALKLQAADALGAVCADRW